MKENFEFPMSNGIALLKPRARNTVLSRFSEDHPGAVDQVMGLLGPSFNGSGSVEVTKSLAQVVLKGLGADDTEAVMAFLCEHITGFKGLENEAGAEVDWKSLEPGDRVDVMDLLISQLDVVSMFMSAWIEYQGLGARPKRRDAEENPTKKKRKRKTPESVKEEAGR